jgi:hypothetical protein
MADPTAHFVDRVFPQVPIRPWVLSFPFDLCYRFAYDTSLVRGILKQAGLRTPRSLLFSERAIINYFPAGRWAGAD